MDLHHRRMSLARDLAADTSLPRLLPGTDQPVFNSPRLRLCELPVQSRSSASERRSRHSRRNCARLDDAHRPARWIISFLRSGLRLQASQVLQDPDAIAKSFALKSQYRRIGNTTVASSPRARPPERRALVPRPPPSRQRPLPELQLQHDRQRFRKMPRMRNIPIRCAESTEPFIAGQSESDLKCVAATKPRSPGRLEWLCRSLSGARV